MLQLMRLGYLQAKAISFVLGLLINIIQMKRWCLPLLLLALVCTQFVRDPIHTGSLTVTPDNFDINSVWQFRLAEVEVVLFKANPWGIYPEYRLFLSAKATRFTMQSASRSKIGLPEYFVDKDYNGSAHSFKVVVVFSLQIQASMFAANYILVSKQYPVFFRTLQLYVSPSTKVQVYDCSHLVRQNWMDKGNGWKFIHSINGFRIKENTQVQDFELELSIAGGPNSSNKGYYLTYFLKDTAPFEEVYVSVAVFGTFVIRDQRVYMFDTVSITTPTTNSIFMTFNKGFVPFFVGITAFGRVGNNEFEFGWTEKGNQEIVDSQQGIKGQRWTGIAKDGAKKQYPSMTSNFLLYGVSRCAAFMKDNMAAKCKNSCVNEYQVEGDVANWRASCLICPTEKVCHDIAVCGDQRVSAGEECDQGMSNGRFGSDCSENCTAKLGFKCITNEWFVTSCYSVCGDGITTTIEECDMGEKNGQNLGCTINCTLQIGFICHQINYTTQCTSNCGDSWTIADEQCDVGQYNGRPQYGCTLYCYAYPGFTCNVTNFVSKCSTFCGNGHTTYDEKCDLGYNNGLPQKGCTSDCQVAKGFKCSVWDFISTCEPLCGDGIVLGEETCDLGAQNGKPHSGCTSECTIQVGFICENSTSPPFCRTNCGDSIVAGKEECDLGTKNGEQGSGCNTDCTKLIGYKCDVTETFASNCYTVCGDGITAGNEQCDNGEYNSPSTAKFYGCDSTCNKLPGFNCIYNNAISTCTTICGDNQVAGNEQCDQGKFNGKPGYPCSAVCLKQEGFYECTPDPFTCKTKCGDSIVAGNEECDNGASNGPGQVCLSDCSLNPDTTKCVEIDPNYSCTVLNAATVGAKSVRLQSEDFMQA